MHTRTGKEHNARQAALECEDFCVAKIEPIAISPRKRGRLPRDKGLKIANETQKASQAYSECNNVSVYLMLFFSCIFIFYHLVAFGYDCVTF